jgi:hypothetical protein
MRLSSLALICVSWASLYAQPYTENQIRTWTTTFGNWNMQVDNIKWYNISTIPPFSYDQIVGVDAVIFSDETKPEVFNFTRLSGERNSTKPSFSKSRSGGYLEVWRFNPSPAYYPLYLKMDRIPCPRPSWDASGCQAGQLRDGFFAADDATFPGRPNRRFSNTAKTRGAVKIDYLCTNCGASTVNTMWVDLGSWNMPSVKSKTFNIDAYNIPPASVVGMSSAIQSDPDASGKVEVDNLEHISTSRDPVINGRMRGGALWWGYGCGTDSPYGFCNEVSHPLLSTYKLIVYRGPSQGGQRNGYSTYGAVSKAHYQKLGPNGSFEDRYIGYSGTGERRGWVKIEYTGTKSTKAIPYAMKTRALPLGAWSMNAPRQHAIDFNQLNVAANRVTSIYTGILSDKACLGDGRKATNFHRPYHSSGHDIDVPDDMAGGVTFIDEKDGKIRFVQIDRSGPEHGFYATCHDGNVDNRGFVKMDFLVGSCSEGPAGFKIQGVPGTDVGNCAGSASTFAFEGSGNDIFGNADDFTYMHKTANADLDIQVKIETQAAAQGWAKSGLMIRADLGAGARHASLLVTPSNGAHLNWRAANGGSSDRNPCQSCANNAIKAPYFLRLVKSGATFTAYARKLSTDGWSTIGSTTISGFPSTYYYGLAQTGFGKAMAKSTFNGFTTKLASGAYFKVLNRNSGKALEVGGSSTADGGAVQQWGYAGGNNQQWQLSDLGNGYYKITARHSGKALEIGSSSMVDGAKAQQWSYAGGNNQQWQVSDLGTGYYRITARHSGKALEIGGSSTVDGTKAQQWSYAGGNNQQWQILAP